MLDQVEESCHIVVLQGLPTVFCFGADFRQISQEMAAGGVASQDPQPLYDLWLRLATGPFISVAQVRGKVNAGGVGFVAACDIVLADESVVFSLSELLFGLFPACVLPFLMRRIGHARAHGMTLMTQPVPVQQAKDWGLVDVCEANAEALLHKQLLRLRRLGKPAVAHYKRYMNQLSDTLAASRPLALEANKAIFSDPHNLHKIQRYVDTGKFPWEGD